VGGGVVFFFFLWDSLFCTVGLGSSFCLLFVVVLIFVWVVFYLVCGSAVSCMHGV